MMGGGSRGRGNYEVGGRGAVRFLVLLVKSEGKGMQIQIKSGKLERGGTPRRSNYSRLFSQVYILSGVILTNFTIAFLQFVHLYFIFIFFCCFFFYIKIF